MIHFKNNSDQKLRDRTCRYGFTLIEAMISIAIMAILATPLFVTQALILRPVVDYSLHLQRIFFAQNFWQEARNQAMDKKKFKMGKKIEDPATAFTYEVAPVSKKSNLGKIENLYAEKIIIQWDQAGVKKKDVIMSYLHKPQGAKKTP